jgi:hypothetical protein
MHAPPPPIETPLADAAAIRWNAEPNAVFEDLLADEGVAAVFGPDPNENDQDYMRVPYDEYEDADCDICDNTFGGVCPLHTAVEYSKTFLDEEPADSRAADENWGRFYQGHAVEGEESAIAESKIDSGYVDIEEFTVFSPPPPAASGDIVDPFINANSAPAAHNTGTPEAATPFVSPRPYLPLHPNGVPFIVPGDIQPNHDVEAVYGPDVRRGLINEPEYSFAPAQAVANAEGYVDIIQFANDFGWPFTQPGDTLSWTPMW